MTQKSQNYTGLTELQMKDALIHDLEERIKNQSKRYAVREEHVQNVALVHGVLDTETKAISFTPEKLDEFVRAILSKAIRGY